VEFFGDLTPYNFDKSVGFGCVMFKHFEERYSIVQCECEEDVRLAPKREPQETRRISVVEVLRVQLSWTQNTKLTLSRRVLTGKASPGLRDT
jgi:hypothetical protein